MLFNKEEVLDCYEEFQIFRLEEIELELQAGNFHNGTGLVLGLLLLK